MQWLQRSSQFPMIFPPCLISTINSRHSSKPSRRKAKISDGSKQRHLLHHAKSSKVKNGRFPASKEDVHKKRRIATARWYKISGDILFKSHVFNLNLPPSLQLSATCLTFGTNDRASNPSQFCWVPIFLLSKSQSSLVKSKPSRAWSVTSAHSRRQAVVKGEITWKQSPKRKKKTWDWTFEKSGDSEMSQI